MSYCFDGVIVVEGKGDASFLSSFIDSLFVVTNGYEINKEEIDFLNHLPTSKQVIVLTDSDEAGKKIRESLNKHLENPINVEVNINKCNKHGKHGVAECEKEEIINVLKGHLSTKTNKNDIWNTAELLSLGIVNSKTRKYICQKLHLGVCNNKTLVKRMNFMGVKIEEVKGVLKQYGDK